MFWLQPSSMRLAATTRTNWLIAFDFMQITSISPSSDAGSVGATRRAARMETREVGKRAYKVSLPLGLIKMPIKTKAPRPRFTTGVYSNGRKRLESYLTSGAGAGSAGGASAGGGSGGGASAAGGGAAGGASAGVF